MALHCRESMWGGGTALQRAVAPPMQGRMGEFCVKVDPVAGTVCILTCQLPTMAFGQTGDPCRLKRILFLPAQNANGMIAMQRGRLDIRVIYV